MNYVIRRSAARFEFAPIFLYDSLNPIEIPKNITFYCCWHAPGRFLGPVILTKFQIDPWPPDCVEVYDRTQHPSTPKGGETQQKGMRQ